MSKTKKNIAYKVKYENGQWRVYVWDHKREIYVESYAPNYLWACRMVKIAKERWNTKDQCYD